MTHRATEAGTSLIEIIFAIVILGIVSSALVAAVATGASGSAAHRDLVTADAVLRNYAETVKQSVRSSCTSGGGTWAATYPPPMPTGFSVNALAGQSCPAVTTTNTVTLTATLPNGMTRSLSIRVRTP